MKWITHHHPRLKLTWSPKKLEHMSTVSHPPTMHLYNGHLVPANHVNECQYQNTRQHKANQAVVAITWKPITVVHVATPYTHVGTQAYGRGAREHIYIIYVYMNLLYANQTTDTLKNHICRRIVNLSLYSLLHKKDRFTLHGDIHMACRIILDIIEQDPSEQWNSTSWLSFSVNKSKQRIRANVTPKKNQGSKSSQRSQNLSNYTVQSESFWQVGI